jgi:hypothetical protein
MYYKKLRRQYFTDDILERIQITVTEYENLRGGKPFTFAQTCAIIQAFSIEAEELEPYLRQTVA